MALSRLTLTAIPTILACAAAACSAQQTGSSNLTVYGSLDQYLNYMRSSSGATVKSLQDGAFVRSRLGFKGLEDLGNGLSAKFNLEMGLSADTGAQGDPNRAFDRQAWVGLADARWGELRLGRQNGPVQNRGDAIDYTGRNLGSVVNDFGVPSRYDNDVAYFSPRLAGVQLEAHYAPGETTLGTGSQAVYQWGVDYTQGPWRAGYAGIRGKAPANAAVHQTISYDNVYGNWDHGQGKVYLTFVRSNNITASTNGNTATQLLGNTGTLYTGAATTAADASRYFNIWQASTDYRLTPAWRVGALWGRIQDTSHSGRSATGASVGSLYDMSKRTTLYVMLQTLHNDTNAGFRPAGSAAISPNFTGNDVNGRKISGTQVGITHRF